MSISNTIENVFIMYNYLVNKKIKFTCEIYTNILSELLRDKGYDIKYEKIIFEFINLGGNVPKGYPKYTDYKNKLKIIT